MVRGRRQGATPAVKRTEAYGNGCRPGYLTDRQLWSPCRRAAFEGVTAVETRPQSPQPSGAPRWVAMSYRPASTSWQVCAESPHRAPVQYALGEMEHTARARGETLTVSLWGPKDDTWQRFDTSAPPAPAPRPRSPSTPAPEEPTKLAERMDSRRRQVLMSALAKAGVHDLAPDDLTAVRTIVDALDETTVRRIAHWLAGQYGQGPGKRQGLSGGSARSSGDGA
jgi:hypothetical protein